MRGAILLLVLLLAPSALAAQEKVLDVLAQQSIPPRRFAPGEYDLVLRHIPSPPALEGANISVQNPSEVTVANASVGASSEGYYATFHNLTLDEHGGWNVFVEGRPVAAFWVFVSTPNAGLAVLLLAAFAGVLLATTGKGAGSRRR